jgi:uncharacterized protein YecT (DUF1311 family)
MHLAWRPVYALAFAALGRTTPVSGQACKDPTPRVASACVARMVTSLDDAVRRLEPQVRDSLNAGVRQLFDSAEDAWRAFRSLSCRADLRFAGAFPPGSDSSRLQCLVEETRRRLGDLRWYLTPASPPADSDAAAELEGLDVAPVTDCLEGSTAEERQCLVGIFRGLQGVRDSLVRKVSVSLSPRERTALDTATYAQEIFAGLECRAESQAQNDGGSRGGVATDMCLVYSRQRHTWQLRRLESVLVRRR